MVLGAVPSAVDAPRELTDIVQPEQGPSAHRHVQAQGQHDRHHETRAGRGLHGPNMSERSPLMPHLHSDLKTPVHERYEEVVARPVGVSGIITNG